MTKARYAHISSWFLRRPALLRLMQALNTWLTRFVYAVYPVLLAVLAITRDGRLWRAIAVPAAVLMAVTLLRKVFRRPRPYEVWDIQPLIPREKKGESFPSRHAACAAVIALTFSYVWPPAGVVMWVITALIALIRALAGVHFFRDVLAGVALSLVMGILGYWYL